MDSAEDKGRFIALFENARQVIKADSAVRAAGIDVTLKPVPETYSTECGMCIELSGCDHDKFIQIVSGIGFTPQVHGC